MFILIKYSFIQPKTLTLFFQNELIPLLKTKINIESLKLYNDFLSIDDIYFIDG